MAIRYGELCKTCTAKECKELPDPRENGCNIVTLDSGQQVTIEGCPQRWIGGEVLEFIRAAELTRKGLPPVAGGQLDQTASFCEAYRHWLAERDHMEARRNPFTEV